MPSQNTVKTYVEGGIYHIYNRGVAKQDIFLEDQDYRAFVRRLKLMLLPPDQARSLQHSSQDRIRLKNFYGEVELLSYCLMPNHFHLLVKQKSESTITEFMRVLSTSYSMYVNKKYERVGPLFQGRYKAALVQDDPYLMHVSRYIHINPFRSVKDIYSYPNSSLQYVFKESCPIWIKPKQIEDYFKSETEHREFIDTQLMMSRSDLDMGIVS